MDLSFLDPQLYATTDADIHYQIRASIHFTKLLAVNHNQLLQQNQAMINIMKDIRTILCTAHNIPNNFTDVVVPAPAYPEPEQQASPPEEASK